MTRRTGLAIVLSVFLGVLAAAGESSAYTQSYVTYWQTTPVGGGNYEYKYWVFNTGGQTTWYGCSLPTECGPPPSAGTYDGVYNERIIDPGPPQVREYYTYSRTPLIWNYEVPILTEAALNSIVPGSIFQPSGWDYQIEDTVLGPSGNWENTTGDPLWDNPYKILHWYTDTNPFSPSSDPGVPPDENGCWDWDGPWCPDSFGYRSVFSAILGPDQTSWMLDIQENTWTATWVPLPPRRGDPDLPHRTNPIGQGGGIPLAYYAPQQGEPVPEPSTVLLVGAGLIGLGFWGRKRLAGRS